MAVRTVLTIGNFDGVHLGHAALLQCARTHADGLHPAGRVVALVFDPSPRAILQPEQAPATLTGFERRSELLREAGADEVVRIAPTAHLLGLAPEAFIQQMVSEHHPAVFVEGADFRFGRARSGDVGSLRELGRQMGFLTDVVAPVEVTLTDQSIVVASSTLVRWLVANGRVRDAALVLGRKYAIAGKVSRGDRRGREIGCPTANVEIPELLPGDGVYAARARLADGRAFGAAVHIGPRATFGDGRRTVEAHLLDWEGPMSEGTPEYGWSITIEFAAWLRDQAKFDSVAQLVEQIERDVARVRQILMQEPSPASAQLREAAV